MAFFAPGWRQVSGVNLSAMKLEIISSDEEKRRARRPDCVEQPLGADLRGWDWEARSESGSGPKDKTTLEVVHIQDEHGSWG